jgi:hypothetical protein
LNRFQQEIIAVERVMKKIRPIADDEKKCCLDDDDEIEGKR